MKQFSLAGLALALALAASAVQAQTTVCQYYVVETGDTIGGIASKFNVQQSALEAAQSDCNSGYTAGGLLQLAQTLCLPPYFTACQNVKAAGGQEGCKYYTVQTGDTLASIAASFNLALLDLQAANPDLTSLQVNDFVKLPGWSDTCPAPGDTTSCRVYVAQEGDSLASIAIAFSVDVASLQEVNPTQGGDTATVLQPGQRINIPPFTAACGAGVIVDKPTAGNCFGYIVEAGDTPYTIATMFQTTTALLLQINPEIATGVLTVGSTVKLPPYDDATCVNGVTIKPRPAGYSPMPSTGDNLGISEQSMTAPAAAPEAAATPAPAPAPFSRRRLV